MNDRIRELWDRAAVGTLPSGPNSWESQVAFIDRLVKLVAEECADVCDLLLDHNISSEWSRGTHACAAAIRKHFGVDNE